jgi:hypothetical protein
MTDSASKPAIPASNAADAPFVEDDAVQTVLPYDTGGVPFYIAFAWVSFIVTYFIVVGLLVVPHLRARLGW